MKATAKAKPRTKRPGSVFIELGDLYHTLKKIASTDAMAIHDNLNMSRTVRRLIHEEATRLGILPKPRPRSLQEETNP
jgi:hypothetical protein